MVIMDKFSQLWTELQQSNRLPRGVLTSQCEAELKEVMTQIDLIFNVKHQEWQTNLQNIKAQLSYAECQLGKQTACIDAKDKELHELHSQLAAINKGKDDMGKRYKHQITSLESSVQKMKCDYDRLHKKYQKSMCRVKQGEMSQANENIEKQAENMATIDARTSDQQLIQLHSEIDRLNGATRQTDKYTTTLKETLDSVTSAHQDSLRTNERLLTDLRQANSLLKDCEEEKCHLNAKLMTAEARLAVVNSEDNDHADMVLLLQQEINKKDEIIRDTEGREREVHAALDRLRLETDSLHVGYEKKCADLRLEISNMKCVSKEETSHLLSEIIKLTDKYVVLENGYTAEGRAFKDELSEVVEEAYKNGIVVANLTSRTTKLEAALEDARLTIQDKDMQLGNALSELGRLREENSRLVQRCVQSPVDEGGGDGMHVVRDLQIGLCSQEIPVDNSSQSKGTFISLTEISPVLHSTAARDGDSLADAPGQLNGLDLTMQSALSISQSDRPESRQSVAQRFLDEETEHAKTLRVKLEKRINELKMNTLNTINRYTVP